MIDDNNEIQEEDTFESEFRPTSSQLKAIAKKSSEFLVDASENELSDFGEEKNIDFRHEKK